VPAKGAIVVARRSRAPDVDHAWDVINDRNVLVPCVAGARVMSAAGPHAVKAEIEVRMGAMAMTFTGPVTVTSTRAADHTVTIRADTRETLGQSYATGDITISLADGEGTIDAIANVGGKAAGTGEGVIVNVLTQLVRSFSAYVGGASETAAAAADEPDAAVQADAAAG